METISGGEVLRRCLVQEGVSVMFGYPGGAILPFYDALYGQTSPRHVLMRHEQFAAFAADGYARATGGVGVCVATSGPGASNLVTGLASSLMDSVPVVAITGQVARPALGTDAFQELDVVGLTMPVTKHAYLVQDVADIPKVVSEAFRVARGGRPGPTLIDVPKDVLLAPGTPPSVGPPTSDSSGPAYEPVSRRGDAGLDGAPAEPIVRVQELLAHAQRPVVMVGRGVVLAGVTAILRAFVEEHELPVITTLLGLDAFPAEHPLCLGMPGMHGHERANLAIQRADLVLGFGLRFDDRVTGRVSAFAPLAQVVHFEISEACAGRTVRSHVRVIGDLRTTLPAFMDGARCLRLDPWWEELRGWSREAEPVDEDDSVCPGAVSGRVAIRMLARRLAARDAIVVTDVGQHQMWLAQELGNTLPGSHITSGGLGAMGFALPGAIGALVGRPDREVWAIAGDGGFQMSAPELATVVQERLPLRIVIHNNAALGLVWQWQSLSYGERFVASRLAGPDFVMLARSHGIPARSVSTAQELTRALDYVDQVEGPVLLDVHVPTEEHVYPMVQPGKGLDEMLRGRELSLR